MSRFNQHFLGILCSMLWGMSALAQCPSIGVLDHWEQPCGAGLLQGQSFTMPESGTVLDIVLAVCEGTDQALVVRAYNGNGSDWDQGTILSTTTSPGTASGSPEDCLVSTQGFDSYTAHTFTFDSLGLIGGEQYVMQLTQGVAASGCNISYSGGEAFTNAAVPDQDLVFTLNFCANSAIIPGCTNPNACNYDINATHLDASCLEADCNGQCGGYAELDLCGVCGGNGTSCLGCMDVDACNFDSSATSDDGSCIQTDCNGDCGGSAFIADCGTCIEGNTGLDNSVCNICPEQVDIDAFGSACGVGLLTGQTFSSSHTGFLREVTLQLCNGMEGRLVVRELANGNGAWDAGAIIGEATETADASAEVTNCLISSNGFANYAEHTFSFSQLGLAADTDYVLHLISGVAASTCSTTYTDGKAFNDSGEQPDTDLAFDLLICPAIINFGCTDSNACNYDPTAEAEDGSCAQLDCNGTCGGSAFLDPDCGCLNSASDAGNCLGCTDLIACNYNPSFSVDDGSCLYPDCNGTCGGSAILSPCGCIGGSTGHSIHACVDECLTASISTSETGCIPGLLHGQTFTAANSGYLKAIRLMTCCALDVHLVVREHIDLEACDNTAPWNAGAILGTAPVLEASCDNLESCLVSTGTGGYQWHTFSFDDLFIFEGTSYTIELISGVALATCEDNYTGGMAFFDDQPNSSDLAMEILTCTEGIEMGCTDPAACSGYNPNATHEDGSCLYSDCHGTCGGEAYEAGNCGCIGGETGIRTAQCINNMLHSVIANDGPTCSSVLYGQDIFVHEDGFLLRTSVHSKATESQSIDVQRWSGPLAGEIVGSTLREATDAPCSPVSREWVQLNFDSVPLEGGMHYRLVFTQGSGSRTCDTDYLDGQGVNSALSNVNSDLAFQWVFDSSQPNELFWGCMNPSSCNFNPNATHDNGTCAEFDCHGDCGGLAELRPNCGCVGGNTGIDPATCLGCLDPSACNYDPLASIDDGTCKFTIDCHGDCGGTAILSPQCGCIEGNTGNLESSCLTMCQGAIAQSSYPSHPEGFELYQSLAFSQSGQTFTANGTAFLTGTTIRNYSAITEPNTIVELRLHDDPTDVKNGTLLATSGWSQIEDSDGLGHDVFVEWPEPVLLSEGTPYVLIFMGIEWRLMESTSHVLNGGNSFLGNELIAEGNDFFLEITTCDALLGCTSPTACNFESWATENDGTCQYAEVGYECDESPCTTDADGDGICASVDLDDLDPYICFDGDEDGCDDCASGEYNPAQDGLDSDGDGYCDTGDLCSDMTADNYDDPANMPCRGECDTAPIFQSIRTGTPASSPWSSDGLALVGDSVGTMLYVSPEDHIATSLQLTGLNGSPDTTLSLPLSPDHGIVPGFYSAVVVNNEGCAGVALAPNGSSFGQTPISLTLIMSYQQCCGACGIFDVDRDTICDDQDNCINKAALNFDDPANEPCEY